MRRRSFKANNPVAVFDTLDRVDNSQVLSAENLPVGLRDGSYAAGTPREPQEGRAYLFNATSRIDIIASNGDISSVSALDETGAIVSMTATYATDRYQITGVDGNYYWNIKCWGNGVTPTDTQKKAYTLQESVEADLFTWFKADEKSGDIAYKAYSGGVNGTIQNLYAGFHATQNIYSWQNEVGYSMPQNLIYRSEEFDVSPWATEGATLLTIPNQAISPFGDLTADLIENVNFTSTGAIKKQSISAPVGNMYRYSIFAKSGTTNFITLGAFRFSLEGGITTFDLNTGVVKFGIGYMEDYGNGWYKCSVNITATNTANQIRIYPSNGNTEVECGAGDNIYIWGAQLSDSFNPTPYVKTESVQFLGGVFIPRDESITLPPFKDVLGNNLQYIGLCPSKVSLVDTPCFQGDGVGYLNIGNISSYEVLNYEVQFLMTDYSIPTALKWIFGNQTVLSTRRSGFEISLTPNVQTIRFRYAYSNLVNYREYSLGFITSPTNTYKVTIKCFGVLDNYTVSIQVNDDFIDFTGESGIQLYETGGITRLAATNSADFLNRVLDNASIADFKFNELSSSGNYVQTLAHWPMPFEIQNPASHTEFDVSGNGSHATGINLSTNNQGYATRPDGDWGQLGYTISDGVNYYYDQALTQLIVSGQYIPAHATQSGKCAAYTTGGVLADLQVTQDGKSFLNSGTKLQAAKTPALVQAEQTNRFFTDVNNDIVGKAFADFTGDEGDDQHFNDISETGKVKNQRTHKGPLTRGQLLTEKQITNNI